MDGLSHERGMLWVYMVVPRGKEARAMNLPFSLPLPAPGDKNGVLSFKDFTEAASLKPLKIKVLHVEKVIAR
jgi:hypothetical protein